MTVLYYTQTYYLDAAIETIRSLDICNLELHLVIEITPDSKCSNIINIASLDNADAVTSFKSLIGEEATSTFEPYFKALKSVQFLVFKKNKVISLDTIKTIYYFSKLMRKIKPSVIHFDTVTLRSLFLLPLFFGLKRVITIHDPIPHLGAASFKTKAIHFINFTIANRFVFYSNYAKNQFEYHYYFLKQPRFVIQFQPYTYNQVFMKPVNQLTEPYILFFGRISFYKGIDILISTIPEILKIYPNQKFIIAGRSEGYTIDDQVIKKYKKNIVFINKYINSSDLVKLIQYSKFLVCPYRDASQSGVLMTALAIGKPVIATSVGAFPEYIQDGHNGLIAAPTSESFLERVLYFLESNRFIEATMNVDSSFSHSVAASNRNLLLQTYF
jgi:glycosyltransferase involved in cell wall biosynthesis